jgi:hypothetical protein
MNNTKFLFVSKWSKYDDLNLTSLLHKTNKYPKLKVFINDTYNTYNTIPYNDDNDTIYLKAQTESKWSWINLCYHYRFVIHNSQESFYICHVNNKRLTPLVGFFI